MQVDYIVIHCSADPNGKAYAPKASAAHVIDKLHHARGFRRKNRQFNPELKAIGYHFVIDHNGTIETGRAENEIGAHVKGHNHHSLGICLIGGLEPNGTPHGRYTYAQWQALSELLIDLGSRYPNAQIVGHRDLSPDINGDGKISRFEWVKACPCFDVGDWLKGDEIIPEKHLFKG